MALITGVKGVGPTTAAALADNGFRTAEKLARAGTADIIVISGIGEARAQALIAAARAHLAATGAGKKPSAKKKPAAAAKKKKTKQASKSKKKKAKKKKAKAGGKKSKKKKSKKK